MQIFSWRAHFHTPYAICPPHGLLLLLSVGNKVTLAFWNTGWLLEWKWAWWNAVNIFYCGGWERFHSLTPLSSWIHPWNTFAELLEICLYALIKVADHLNLKPTTYFIFFQVFMVVSTDNMRRNSASHLQR